MSKVAPSHDWPIDKGLTTRQLAENLGIKPLSILVSKAQNGGRYRGLLPKRLKNGHLRWPPDSVARIERRASYIADHWLKSTRRASDQY